MHLETCVGQWMAPQGQKPFERGLGTREQMGGSLAGHETSVGMAWQEVKLAVELDLALALEPCKCSDSALSRRWS